MTTFLPSREELLANPPPPLSGRATGEVASVGDIIGAAATSESLETNAWDQEGRTRMGIMQEITSRFPPDYFANDVLAEFQQSGFNHDTRRPDLEAKIFEALAAKQAEDPAAWGDITINSVEALDAEVIRIRRAEYEDAQKTLNMGGAGSGLAEFIGRGAVAMTDELSLAMAPLGFGGGFLRTVATEAALGAAGEAAILPRMNDQAEKLDIPDPNALAQITMGAAFGGVLGGAVHAVASGARRFNQYRAGRNQMQAEGDVDGETLARDTEAALANDEPVPVAPVREVPITFELEGKIRSMPISSDFQARLNGVVAPLGEDIGIIVTSAGQAPIGSGGPRTGSVRHDVDVSGHSNTADLVLTRNGVKITPSEDPELYARFFTNAAAVFPGLGHYDWGVHVGGGSVAAWGPDRRSASLDPYFGKAINAGRTGQPFEVPLPTSPRATTNGASNIPTGTRAGYTAPGQVVTPSGTRIDVAYEVVDASLLTRASGELQPRDRTRAASDAQITQIAAELDPARLMPSSEADRGAPIIGPDNVIESGNGRVAAIQQAAPDRKAAYRAAINEAGFDIPEGMADPVLVARRQSDLTPEARVDFVNDANTSSIARMSATEQAAQDARGLSSHTMAQYSPGKPISAPENTTFARAFLEGLPANERAALTTAEGRLNLDGERRLKQALFARAYGAPDLIAKHTEAADPAMRSLIDALAEAAPAWSALRADIEAGLIKPEMDLTAHLLDAVRLIGDARRNASKGGGSTAGAIDDALAQISLDGQIHPLTEALVQIFRKGDRVRPDREITELLDGYTNEARIVGKTDAALFSDELSSGPMEVLDAIQKETDLFAPGGPGTRPRDESLYRQPNRPAAQSGGGQARAPLDTSQIDEQGYIDGAQSDGSIAADAQGAADLRAAVSNSPSLPFGPEISGFRNNPEGAIKRLMETKSGEVTDAFEHPDLGNIAFVYGNENFGLRHIQYKHGDDVLADLPRVLRDGHITKQLSDRVYIQTNDTPPRAAVIRLDYDGQQKTWLVTSFDDQRGTTARQVQTSDEPPASAPSRIPDATGQGLDITSTDKIQEVQVSQALKEVRESIVAADDFEITTADGQTYRASEILDDLDADANLADIINLCNPKGGA